MVVLAHILGDLSLKCFLCLYIILGFNLKHKPVLYLAGQLLKDLCGLSVVVHLSLNQSSKLTHLFNLLKHNYNTYKNYTRE